jgi:mannosyltransferase
MNNSKLIGISISVFVVNLIIKVLFLTHYDIALDEPFTIFYSQKSITELYSILESENNPPLHFIFLHFWIKLFGIGAFAVRFPSVLFSSLTAIVLFTIGNRFFHVRIGLLASALFSLSTMQVFFAHEARVYPLFIFLTALSLYFFLCILESNNLKYYLLLLTCNTLLIYAHYFGFFVLITEACCFFLFFEQKQKYIKSIAMYLLLQILFYLPIFKIFITRATNSLSTGTWVAKPHISELYGNINRFLNDRFVTLVLILTILTLSIIFIKKMKSSSFRLLLEKLTKAHLLVIFFFVFPYLTMYILSLQSPMFIDRYILFTTIPLYLSIAIVIHTLSLNARSFYVSIFTILITQLCFINLKPDNNRRIKEVAELVKSNIQKANHQGKKLLVLISPAYADLSFLYHYNQTYFKRYSEYHKLLKNDGVFAINSVSDLAALNPLSYDEVLLIEAGNEFVDPNHEIRKKISSEFPIVEKKSIFEIYELYSCVK